TIAAGVDVLRPGVLLMAARGPARHQGGEEALAEGIIDAVAELTGWDCSVGIADGPFAALLAAGTGRRSRPGRGAGPRAPHPLTPRGSAPVGPGWGHRGQPAATRPERRLDLAETVDLLQRLGIATLGDLAALPTAAVTDRFGPDVATLHLLAQGQEPAPQATHHPAQTILAEPVLDTPLVRTDQAAFIARPLAEQLHEMLLDRGWCAPGCGSWPAPRAARRWSAPGGTTGPCPSPTWSTGSAGSAMAGSPARAWAAPRPVRSPGSACIHCSSRRRGRVPRRCGAAPGRPPSAPRAPSPGRRDWRGRTRSRFRQRSGAGC